MRRSVWFLLLLAACCTRRLAEVDRTEFGFGSYIRIKALAPNKTVAESAAQEAFREMLRLDTLWSSFLPGSEVSMLNRAGRARVSPETRELVSAALGFCAGTEGALDITIRPVLDAWGITGQEKSEVRNQKSEVRSQESEIQNWRVPDSAELTRARRLVDYRQVTVRGDSVILADGAQIDLGAVAVGYAVDRAVEMLKQGGVEQALVDAGGDIRVFGNRVWRIGIKNPRKEGITRVLEVKDRAVSTSGDYEKFFEKNGQRYCHIVDPATGFPANKCCSVTILAPTTLAADGFATAVFVLGPERGMEVVRQQPGMAAVVYVDSAGTLEAREEGKLE